MHGETLKIDKDSFITATDMQVPYLEKFIQLN